MIAYKKGVLNVLLHNLSHLYACIKLDRRKGKPRKELHLSAQFLISDPMGEDAVARRMHQFVREVLHKKDPNPEERGRLVKELYQEGHIEADLMFKMLFKEGYY